MSETEDYLPEDTSAFDLEGWLTTGTVVRREVPAWADQVAVRRVQEIEARLTELGVAEDPEADGPLSAGDENAEEIAALKAEAAVMLDRMTASKAVFTVRGITPDEVEQIARDHPAPPPPVGAPQKASPEQQQKAMARLARYAADNTEVDKTRMLHMVALCVETITTPAGVKAGISVSALRALRAEAWGDQLIKRLWTAIQSAAMEAVPVPGPTSPGSSTGTRA